MLHGPEDVIEEAYDKSRFFENLYPDPSVPPPLVVSDPNTTSLLRTRLQKGWDVILCRRPAESHGDFSVYTGTAGVGYLALHTAMLKQGDERRSYLDLAKRYLKASQSAAERHLRHGHRDDITFIMGSPGIYAMIAVVETILEKRAAAADAIQIVLRYSPIIRSPESTYPYEILYGATGYLTTLLYLKQHIPDSITDDTIREVVNHIMSGADKGPQGSLQYYWHRTMYLGGAHGLSGIVLALLDAHAFVQLKPEYLTRIRATVEYIYSLKLPSGNYPTRPNQAYGNDKLIQWCHGAPGILLMFVRAYETLADPRYLAWAEDASDVVWTRGLLKKGNGLCHGISGNAYCFLSVYRVTGNDRYLHRARQFASAAEDELVTSHQGRPDAPYSLFEGHAGLLALYTDLVEGDPARTRFPAVEMG